MNEEYLGGFGLTAEESQKVIQKANEEKSEAVKTAVDSAVKDALENVAENGAEGSDEYEALKQEKDAKENQLKTLQELLIEKTIVNSGVKNPKVVKSLINLDEVKFEDGGITGLDEQLDELKKTDAYLFAEDDKKKNKDEDVVFTTGEHNRGKKTSDFARGLFGG